MNTNFGAGSALEKRQKSRVRWYDYGARFYEPAIGRWQTVDAMAEMDKSYSTYVYGQNNPISNIDIGGKFVFKDAANRPQLANLLKNISKVLDDPNIMRNLQKFSGLDAMTIRSQFKFNSGPEIIERDLFYYAGLTVAPLTIQLDRYAVNSLENSIKDRRNLGEYDDYLCYVLLTILHEYVHSGDLQLDGKRSDSDQPMANCLGFQFEKATFGVKAFGIADIQKYFKPSSTKKDEGNNSQKKRSEFWRMLATLPVGNYKVVDGKIVPTK